MKPEDLLEVKLFRDGSLVGSLFVRTPAMVAELEWAFSAENEIVEHCISKDVVRNITDLDRGWPLLAPCGIAEHLTGEERPLLSCALADGRSYRLDEAQRQIIREWYNMTCSPEVMVEMLATFPDNPTIIREVIIRSEQHIDPENLRVLNGPRKVTIDRWGEFCTAVAGRRVENADRRECDALIARVARLFKKAKESKPEVHHRLKTPGSVGQEWHARVVQKRVEAKADLSPDIVRDILRDILTVRNEHGLVALVADPSFGSAASRGKLDKEMAEVDAEMDALLATLGIQL